MGFVFLSWDLYTLVALALSVSTAVELLSSTLGKSPPQSSIQQVRKQQARLRSQNRFGRYCQAALCCTLALPMPGCRESMPLVFSTVRLTLLNVACCQWQCSFCLTRGRDYLTCTCGAEVAAAMLKMLLRCCRRCFGA